VNYVYIVSEGTSRALLYHHIYQFLYNKAWCNIGKCSDSGALDINVYNGALVSQKGKKCLARKVDNTAVMVPCKEASEFIAIDVPMMPSTEEMTKMLKNPVSS